MIKENTTLVIILSISLGLVSLGFICFCIYVKKSELFCYRTPKWYPNMEETTRNIHENTIFTVRGSRSNKANRQIQKEGLKQESFYLDLKGDEGYVSRDLVAVGVNYPASPPFKIQSPTEFEINSKDHNHEIIYQEINTI